MMYIYPNVTQTLCHTRLYYKYWILPIIAEVEIIKDRTLKFKKRQCYIDLHIVYYARTDQKGTMTKRGKRMRKEGVVPGPFLFF